MAKAYDILDDNLLALWKNGDEQAFASFYNRYFLHLVNMAAKKLGAWEIAEELVQDTLIALYENHTIESSPIAFCYRVLKNKIIDEYRRQKLPVVKPANDTPATGLPGGEGHQVEYKELESQLAEYIEQLPDQARKVFLLRREGNLSNLEVAQKLGISVKMVEAHMTKAMKFLKANLEYIVWLGIAGSSL